MGSVGDAYDNAMAESFFATLECELLDRCRFKTQAEARMAVFQFIEASTIRAGGTHRSAICRRSTTSAVTTRERLIPTHVILPPCSGPSRCSLDRSDYASSPAQRPTLTAPARAGLRNARAEQRNT